MKTKLTRASQFGFRSVQLLVAIFLTLTVSPVFAAPNILIKARFVEIPTNSDTLEDFELDLVTEATYFGPAFTTALSESKLHDAIKELEQRHGANLLNEGQVTTLSGKQAQLQISKSTNYMNGLTLDVVPTLADDGFTISLVLIPTITETIANDKPGDFVPTVITNSSESEGVVPAIMGPLPLPHTRVRQLTTSCTIKDGQTIVLKAFTNAKRDRRLLMIVTPTLIDTSGNPVHSTERPGGSG